MGGRRIFWLALSLGVIGAAALGCTLRDTELSPPSEFSSGTRLRARVYAIDGVKVLLGFHDVVRGVDCTFFSATDDIRAVGPEFPRGLNLGPARVRTCLPAVRARHEEGVGPFADADCRVKVASVTEGTAPDVAVLEPRDACSSGLVIHRAAPVERGRTWHLSAGVCTSSSPRPEEFVRLGERMPDDAFVRAEETVESRGAGRLAARVLKTKDGARQVIGGWDLQRGAAASPHSSFADDETRRWVPTHVGFVGFNSYTDAACMEQAASKLRHSAVCPLSAVFEFSPKCGVGSFHEIGPEFANFSTIREGRCVADPADDRFAFAVGAPIPSASFEPVLTKEIGSGRVRRRGLTSASGEIVMLEAILDRGEPCEPAMIGDVLRCVPPTIVEVDENVFADAACTEPTYAEATGDEECRPSPVPGRVRAKDDSVYEVTGELQTVFVQGLGGTCRPRAPGKDWRHFGLRPFDSSPLPRVTIEVE